MDNLQGLRLEPQDLRRCPEEEARIRDITLLHSSKRRQLDENIVSVQSRLCWVGPAQTIILPNA